MSLTGTVKNGVIVLPPGTQLPEGAEVRIEALLTAAGDSLVAAIEKPNEAARQMEVAQDVMQRYRHTLRELAK